MRRRYLLATAVFACLLTGCADDAGTQTPSPVTTPSLPAQAVIIYVLTPAMVPGYTRTSDLTLNAAALADQKADSALPARLAADGFVHGARASYAPPPSVATPAFTAINSDALLFTDAKGAQAYYAEEAGRINTAPTGGTLDSLGGLPQNHVDALLAFASSQPPQGGDEVDRAFIVLMRTGRVVTEIFARGASAAATTASAFQPLVTAEEGLLARPPEG